MRLSGRRIALVAVFFTLATLPGCRFFDSLWDRLEACHDTEILIVNDEQTRADAFIIGPDEPVIEALRLHSGESRKITLCLEIGHSYRFRAFQDEKVVATAHCPASRREYENDKPSVVWTPIGLRCVDW